MNGRHALTMACSSGHPSQTDNYLDTKKHPKTNSSELCGFCKRETGGSGPRRAKLECTVPTIKIFSMLD
jgi:hypothetical protein